MKRSLVAFGFCLLFSTGLLAVPDEPEAGPAQSPERALVASDVDAEPSTDTEPASDAMVTSSPYRFGQEKDAGDQALKRAGATTGLSLGKIVISLAFVILMVLLLGWSFKKLTLRMPGSQHMKVISTIPLGPKERLLVIEMQGKQRVLGVTAHQINFLFELDKPLPEEKLASEFHSQLQSWLKK